MAANHAYPIPLWQSCTLDVLAHYTVRSMCLVICPAAKMIGFFKRTKFFNRVIRATAFNQTQPLSYLWGTDRGIPPHRHYVEGFLSSKSNFIRGHCLEFQEDRYSTCLGKNNIQKIDILHIDDSNKSATIVADLTRPNSIASNTFDCIICTFVLHVVENPSTAIREMHRILKPSGSLLVAVPQVSMDGPEYNELWRFTQAGLRNLLARSFPSDQIDLATFGNVLTTSGDLRGMVVTEFTQEELGFHDHRFAMVVCGHAQKTNL